MSICVALSCLGLLNGCMFSASRAIFAAARKNHMPSVLALVNIKFRTPITSISFITVLSLLCLYFDDIYVLLELTILTENVFIGSTVIGLLYLRKKCPGKIRPIKVNLFFPIVFIVINFLIITITIYASPYNSMVSILVIASGIPVYLFFVLIKTPKSLENKINAFTECIQKFTLSVIDTKQD